MSSEIEAKSKIAEGEQSAQTPLDADTVVAYLKANPKFFEHHPDALMQLSLHHESGTAVSLIERQVEVLRAQYGESQRRLNALVGTARENESRVTHLNALAQSLITADSLTAVARGVRERLSDSFQVDGVFLGLLGHVPENADPQGPRFIPPKDPLREAFRDFFRTGKAECGPLTAEKSALLFPDREAPLRSAALVPLDRASKMGMLVLAGADPGRFTPAMGTWFLELTAQLVATACRVHLPRYGA